MVKKTVLVTGMSGYIGGETALRLKDAGYQIIGVDTVPLSANLRSVADRFYQEDFSKPGGLRLLEEFAPIAVVHCAGTSLVGPSMTRPADYYHNNFIKTKSLLDRICLMKLDTRVIFSSSAACYGEPVITPCAEGDLCEPISPYGETKLMIEWMLKAYRQAYGVDFVAFRYFNACGADSQGRHGQRPGATHIIARVLESLRDNKEFTLYGEDYDTADGTCVRDYVHVEDIADAHVRAIDQDVLCDIYNLGTKKGASNREIISAAERITGQSVRCLIGPKRKGDPATLTADAAKFHNISGWQPKFTLDEQISHAWNWYTR